MWSVQHTLYVYACMMAMGWLARRRVSDSDEGRTYPLYNSGTMNTRVPVM